MCFEERNSHMRLKPSLMSLFLLCVFSLNIVKAQELCEVLVREIWEQVTDNCGTSDSDQSACYGHDSAKATFTTETNSLFSNPGDLAELITLFTMYTLPFDEVEEEWGVSVFQINAQAFGGSPQERVIIMLAGDVIVENAAHDKPDVLPFQEFNFTTGGKSKCREAPNAVFIQSPNNFQVDLTINSVPIRIGSSIVLGTETNENGRDLMYFGVIDGKLTINPDTPDEQVVNEGEFTSALLTDEQGNGLNNEPVLENRRVPVIDPLTGEQIIGPNGQPFFRQVPADDFTPPEPFDKQGDGVNSLSNFLFVNYIPTSLLNYDVQLEEPEDEPDTADSSPPPSAGSTTGTTTTTSSTLPEESDPVDNWCAPGGPWDDGRCNNPDPTLANWYWQAGWYNAAYEAGLIDAVPAEYAAPPSEIPPPAVTPTSAPPTFNATITGCTDFVTHYEVDVTYTNLPAGAANTRWNWATTPTTQSTASPNTIIADLVDFPLASIEVLDGSAIVIAIDSSLNSMPPCTS